MYAFVVRVIREQFARAKCVRDCAVHCVFAYLAPCMSYARCVETSSFWVYGTFSWLVLASANIGISTEQSRTHRSMSHKCVYLYALYRPYMYMQCVDVVCMFARRKHRIGPTPPLLPPALCSVPVLCLMVVVCSS